MQIRQRANGVEGESEFRGKTSDVLIQSEGKRREDEGERRGNTEGTKEAQMIQDLMDKMKEETKSGSGPVQGLKRHMGSKVRREEHGRTSGVSSEELRNIRC